jgi:cell division cycle 14
LLTARLLQSHSELIHFYCFDNAYRFTTAVCSICAFKILNCNASAEDAFRPFAKLAPCFMPFNDASFLPATHLLTVESFVKRFYKGISHGWYSPLTFDVEDYAHDSQSCHGNMNWIIPGKLFAMASPFTEPKLPNGYEVATPADLIEPFKQKGITHVIGLNERFYDEKSFTRAGFHHTDLFFDDGSCPPAKILDSFLRIVSGSDVVALHCKVGLGRTHFSTKGVNTQRNACSSAFDHKTWIHW